MGRDRHPLPGLQIMAVFMLTLHAYRSWMPDHPRGFVIRGKGIQGPDPRLARRYHALARHERMVFSDERCEQIIAAVREECEKQQWRLLAIVVVWTHMHVIVSWQGFRSVKRVRAVLKRAITTWLRDWSGEQRKWLAGGGSIKRVRDRDHYLHLTRRYLPRHRRYGGRQWYEYEERGEREEPRRG
jgi:REP element-mobilizing transposase RayT